QHPIVQGTKSLRRILKLSDPSLDIAHGTILGYRLRNCRGNLVISGTCKLVVLAERSSDALLLIGNRFAHLIHPGAYLDYSQMILSNASFDIPPTDGKILQLLAHPCN